MWSLRRQLVSTLFWWLLCYFFQVTYSLATQCPATHRLLIWSSLVRADEVQFSLCWCNPMPILSNEISSLSSFMIMSNSKNHLSIHLIMSFFQKGLNASVVLNICKRWWFQWGLQMWSRKFQNQDTVRSMPGPEWCWFDAAVWVAGHQHIL